MASASGLPRGGCIRGASPGLPAPAQRWRCRRRNSMRWWSACHGIASRWPGRHHYNHLANTDQADCKPVLAVAGCGSMMTATPTLDHLDAQQLRELATRLRVEMRLKQVLIDKLTHEMAILKRLKFAALYRRAPAPAVRDHRDRSGSPVGRDRDARADGAGRAREAAAKARCTAGEPAAPGCPS